MKGFPWCSECRGGHRKGEHLPLWEVRFPLLEKHRHDTYEVRASSEAMAAEYAASLAYEEWDDFEAMAESFVHVRRAGARTYPELYLIQTEETVKHTAIKP